MTDVEANVHSRKSSGPLEKVLSAVADVRPGEGPTAVLLTLNVFLLLTAYYLLKVAREPLILMGGGAEVKQFAAAGQSALLVVVTLAYGAIASRYGRMKLIAGMNFFFVSNLVVFAILAGRLTPIGVPFYLWVGVFNRTVIAQFWAFGADIYAGERGKRLFAVLGVGSSAGATAGAAIADKLLFLGPSGLMWTASVLLVVCVGISYVVHRRESASTGPGTTVKADAAFGPENGFAMMFRDKYLIFVGLLLLILNLVNSMGEYILDRTLLAGAASSAAAQGITTEAFIGKFKASYFEWINVLGMLLQLFAVSRIIRYVGVRKALFVMPAVSFMGYASLLFFPVISVVFFQKVVENSLDYSLANTAQQSLWLVTSREAKYKVKQITDTFIVRAGDVLTAILVWVGRKLHVTTSVFVVTNLVAVAIWLMVLGLVAREHRRREAAPEATS